MGRQEALRWAVAALIAVIAALPLFATLRAASRGRAADAAAGNACEMTYMRPQYHLVPSGALLGAAEATNASALAHALYRYTNGAARHDTLDEIAAWRAEAASSAAAGPDGALDKGAHLSGEPAPPPPFPALPVVFVPGSGGSYRQARSLGGEAAKVWSRRLSRRDRGASLLEAHVYTADLGEELSGASGVLLARQAMFVQAVTEALARAYGRPVVLVAHSVGAAVARAASAGAAHRAALEGTLPPVRAVLSVAGAARAPPLGGAAQRALRAFYARADAAWAALPREVSTNITLLDVNAGHADDLVRAAGAAPPPWEAAADPPPPRGVLAGLPAMPGAWLSTDHQAAVWCNQLARPLAETLTALPPLAAADGAAAAAAAATTARSQLRRRFAPDARRALGGEAHRPVAAAALGRCAPGEAAARDAQPPADPHGLPASNKAVLAHSAGQYAWEVPEMAADGVGAFVLLVGGAPCADFRVHAWGSRKRREPLAEFSALAYPLPAGTVGSMGSSGGFDAAAAAAAAGAGNSGGFHHALVLLASHELQRAKRLTVAVGSAVPMVAAWVDPALMGVALQQDGGAVDEYLLMGLMRRPVEQRLRMPRSPVLHLRLPVSPAWVPANIALRKSGLEAERQRRYAVARPHAIALGAPAFSSLTPLSYGGRAGLVRAEAAGAYPDLSAGGEVALVLEPSADLFVVVEPDMDRAAWALVKGRLAAAAYPLALVALLVALAAAEAVTPPVARRGAFLSATGAAVCLFAPAGVAAAAWAALGGWAAAAMVALLYVLALPLAHGAALLTALAARACAAAVPGAGSGWHVAARALDAAAVPLLAAHPSAAATLGAARVLLAAGRARRAAGAALRRRYTSREAAENACYTAMAHAERTELWAAVVLLAAVPHLVALVACAHAGAWLPGAVDVAEVGMAAPLALLPLCLGRCDGDGLDARPILSLLHLGAAGYAAWPVLAAGGGGASGVPEAVWVSASALCVAALAARREGAKAGDYIRDEPSSNRSEIASDDAS